MDSFTSPVSSKTNARVFAGAVNRVKCTSKLSVLLLGTKETVETDATSEKSSEGSQH